MNKTIAEAPVSNAHRYATPEQKQLYADLVCIVRYLGERTDASVIVTEEIRDEQFTVRLTATGVCVCRICAGGATVERFRPGRWQRQIERLAARAAAVEARKRVDLSTLDKLRFAPIDDEAIFASNDNEEVAR